MLGFSAFETIVVAGLAMLFIAACLLVRSVSRMGQKLDSAYGNDAVSQLLPQPAVAGGSAPMSVQDGIDEETVAVISAAVAAVMGQPGKNYAIKSIQQTSQQPSRRVGERPLWGYAGMRQNIRPF